MFFRPAAYRRIIQPPRIRGCNARRTYTKGVDQASGFSDVLAEWRMMRWFMGGLGTLVIGETALDFTLMAKVAVCEAHLDEMRRDIALIKGKGSNFCGDFGGSASCRGSGV
ncbi:hypothetical protein TWF481_005376 [Arthrobotrys musiformis]|uniref:Uncharacterized protein n=1 Tax=Arthrobotrys musiformis TaxID=47236 RepID=A0AAV9WF98_9PEZI